jgi:hypothetical protein
VVVIQVGLSSDGDGDEVEKQKKAAGEKTI